MTTSLPLIWNGRVITETGWSGRLRGAFLAPRSGRVTHLLVQMGLFQRAYAVPLTAGRIGASDALVIPSSAVQMAPDRGSVRLTDKIQVNLAGEAASLRGLIIDQKDGIPLWLLVRYQQETIAVENLAAHNLVSGSLSLRLTQQEKDNLPVYRADGEALRNVLVALEEVDLAGGSTFGDVRVDVQGGVARLGGTVWLVQQREEAERAAISSQGVLAIQNDIITDWDLRIGIATALAKANLSQTGLIVVRSKRGKISLKGHLPSRWLLEEAVRVASETIGVRSVESDVVIVQELATSAGSTIE